MSFVRGKLRESGAEPSAEATSRLSAAADGAAEPSERRITLEPLGLSRQLDELQRSLGGESRGRSSRELQVLRKTLEEEQLAEFRTQKPALLLDMREALLGRLTAPSVRLAEQLDFDPQVKRALTLAANVAEYDALLSPPTADGALPTRAPPSPQPTDAASTAARSAPSAASEYLRSAPSTPSGLFPPEEVGGPLPP